MKRYLLLPLVLLFFACSEQKGPFDFDKVKTDLNLSVDQSESYDLIIEKYTAKRQSVMTGDEERETKLNKMRAIMKNQIDDTYQILTEDQKILFEPIAEQFTKFGHPGYSQKFMTKMDVELQIDSTQQKQVRLINQAFEKAYIDAHDYYHGKPDVAKEYWEKFDVERRKALKSILTENQFQKYEVLAVDEVFKSEH